MDKQFSLECDVVIIGTGPGGATVARELAKKKKKVIILEWGKNVAPGGGVKRDLFKYLGGFAMRKQIMIKPQGTSITLMRGLTTGGGTAAYGGIAYDPPVDGFSEYGFDISKELAEIKEEIHVQPLPDEFICPKAKLLMKSALGLGYAWEKHEKLIKDPSKIRYADNSAYMGDNSGSRWSAYDWIMEAVKAGGALMTETYCEKILIRNNVALGVLAKNSTGKDIEIYADKVIVAAGAIGSAELLQKSGLTEAGQKLFIDPYLQLFGHVRQDIEQVTEPIRQAGVLLKDEGIILGDGALPRAGYNMAAFKSKKFLKALKMKNVLTILVEIADESNGSVNAKGEVFKTLTTTDYAKLDRGAYLAENILRHAGARDIWKSQLGGVHLGGTCGIGDVVDSDLKTAVDNLYVADSSVLPKAKCMPPVLTIMALAKRLSKQLV